MASNTRAVTIVVVAAALVACKFMPSLGPTPKSTFAEMQDAACDGDVQRFFNYVDKTKLRQNAIARVKKSDELGASGPFKDQLVESIGGRVVGEIMTEWEDDIKRGSASKLCQMEFVGENRKLLSLNTRTVSGTNKFWEFERAGDKLLVVNLM